MADKSKDIKKHQNAPTKHTERVKYYYVDFQMNAHSFLPITPFFEVWMKLPKTWQGDQCF